MKNSSTLVLYKILTVCILSLFSIERTSAQENGVFELNKNSGKSSKITTSNKVNDRAEFNKLSQKLHTTAYINNKVVSKTRGDGEIQKLIFGDSKSFGVLNQNNYNKAELITIVLKDITDLNNTIDLTKNYNLDSLKYVFIKCYFKCTSNQIEEFISSNSNIRVFYTSQTPS